MERMQKDDSMCRRTRFFIVSFFFVSLLGAFWHFTAYLDMGFLGNGQPSWQTIAAHKRAELMAKIPGEWRLSEDTIKAAGARRVVAGEFFDNLLDTKTLRITRMDPVNIVGLISEGSLSSVDVVSAFCKRAAFAHQVMPTLLEIGFDQALRQAAELDEYYAKYGKVKGPLHGLPVTFKDQFHIKGLETSFAYVGWIGTFEGRRGTGKEGKVESELIRELISLGAVPIAKTTLMMTTWAPETNNNILGYLWNPFNKKVSSGGSSGGEGIIQALRGSAFGFGTDSGGSVSMPASYNGVSSFKPSTGRISFKGAVGSGLGNLVMTAVAGILGPSVPTLQLVFKSLLDTQPWKYDAFVLPIPWRKELELHAKEDIVIGFMAHDGHVQPHPPIARALRITADALRKQNIKTIEWKPPAHVESTQLHGPLARGDSCVDAWNNIQLSGEAVPPEILDEFPDGKLLPPMSLPDYENATLHLIDFRNRYHAYWESTSELTGTGRPVDAVIMPVSPYSGVQPGKFMYSPYSSIINVLDYCSAALPVTVTDKSQDILHPDWKPLNDVDKANMDTYDAEALHGSPAGIQIFGRHLEEERLLSAAAIVATALRDYNGASAE